MSVRLTESTVSAANQAYVYMGCIESLEVVRTKLQYWLNGAESGDFDSSDLWHLFRWLHQEFDENLRLMNKAGAELDDQVSTLQHALGS